MTGEPFAFATMIAAAAVLIALIEWWTRDWRDALDETRPVGNLCGERQDKAGGSLTHNSSSSHDGQVVK